MIQAISSSNNTTQYKPKFKGALDLAVYAIQKCEQVPMVNVAVIDAATSIIPRTVLESQTNTYAGLEAFRRESSGLIINCMIPGFIVAGIAKAIQKPVMGNNSAMSNCWANEDTINLVTKYWSEASDKAIVKNGKTIFKKGEQAKAYNTIRNILKNTEGVDGEKWVKFNKLGVNFDDSVKTITENIFKNPKITKENTKAISNAYKKIVEKTHINDNIKVAGQKSAGTLSQGLGDVVKNSAYILKDLSQSKVPTETFAKNAKKLVTAKSLGGLGIIIPLAIAAQPINRWITEKTSGQKGAPIYKDFGKNKTEVKVDKAGLLRQKIISISSMVGLALLSIMKKPDVAMLKNITQFKGIFPSMDQARIISTATFASRMGAAQDENDLKVATVRDLTTFSALYFLGDYVSKGIATLIQKKKGINLINVLKKAPDDANILKKFGYWAKNTALKSSDELATPLAKKMRAICQLGNLGFSFAVLGVIVPIVNQHRTNKKCNTNKC